ncbi:hypothetical protein ZHAS_00014941 [Anopheles sinensis]|uniref:Uncharacterized protein n=1 Tax=Anopheles sinensis TaxID=74873 RepID=A0A084W9N6_ANOSI|nr:hypothetical protein ZHAS_00014941 [Anopheles sinensis]
MPSKADRSANRRPTFPSRFNDMRAITVPPLLDDATATLEQQQLMVVRAIHTP